MEGKLPTFFTAVPADGGYLVSRIINPIKTRYAQWECTGISLQAKDTWDKEAEAPKAWFHLQIPGGLRPELVVFPPQAKGLPMLSFHELWSHWKRWMCFFIISKIGYAISSDIGYDSLTQMLGYLHA